MPIDLVFFQKIVLINLSTLYLLYGHPIFHSINFILTQIILFVSPKEGRSDVVI